jgi:hypothetical protein
VGNKKNNTIEINGRRYDAGTGRPLDGIVAPQAKSAAPVIKPVINSAQAIPVQLQPDKPKRPKAVVHDAVRHAKTAKRHAPEHSKTLMRHTVKKPPHSLKRHLKARGSTDSLVKKPATVIAPKRSAKHIDAQKLNHASQVPKSHMVKKFNRHQPASIAVPVTVRKIARPAKAHHASPEPSAPAKRASPADELLNHALRHATSHEQRPPKKIDRKRRGPSRRLTSLAALSLAAVVLGGFVVYSNLANMRLKVASAKAGFSASLPEQRPAGYHLSHLNYSPGVVALHFHSNSDSRSFAITEKASAWDSGTLRDTYVANSGQDYQTVESGGRTLYLLGQNVATWVSGGVWYQVQANGSLSHQQLVALATSL